MSRQPGRPKGGSKFGGRKGGTPNKIKVETLKERVCKVANNAPLTPLECLIDVMSGSTSYTAQQIDAAKAAAPYVHAKKIHAEVDHTFTQLGDRLDQALKRVRGTVVDIVPQIIDAAEEND